MRFLITGAGGFVGPYAARAVRNVAPDARIVGGVRGSLATREFDEVIALDVTDTSSIRAALETIRPTHVLHLAGVAAPQSAGADPVSAWQINTLGTLSLGRCILNVSPETVLLNAGSASAYGDSANRFERIDEDAPFAPSDEYGSTKAAADLALGALSKRGLNLVRLRPFNHTGPGQTEDYAIAGFAAQIAQIESGQREPIVKVGNLDAVRDFCDVTDIARGYAVAAVAASSGGIPPGRSYNLCSGQGIRMRTALELLLSMSSTHIEVQSDPKRMRPSDIPRIVGNPDRAGTELLWRATRSIEETLHDTLQYWRQMVSAA